MQMLPRRRRALRRIQRELVQSDPRLARLFWIFTRLAGGQELPKTERIRAMSLPGVLRRLRLVRRAGSRARAGAHLGTPLLIAAALIGACALVATEARYAPAGACSLPAQHATQAQSAACAGRWRWAPGR